jgi:hypothetical protein
MLKYARGCSAEIMVGEGDYNNGLLLILGIPFLFNLYISFPGFIKTKHPHRTGISIHSNAVWIHPFTNDHSQGSHLPWYEGYFHWSFPWEWNWRSTEIMGHTYFDKNMPQVFIEIGPREFGASSKRDEAADSVTRTYRYTYHMKGRKTQYAKANVYVERMTWRMKWWPLLPFSKTRTSISVRFDREIGEQSGSYKGGCTGCGYDMLPSEHPLDTLRRMERERRFE